MKAIVHDARTEIFLTGEEFKEHCLPGEGANTCIWAVVGAEGFECCYYNKPSYLLERWKAGKTVAKRDGCDKVKAFDPSGKEGEVIF